MDVTWGLHPGWRGQNSGWGWSIGVAQHGCKRAPEVVGDHAAVVLIRHGHQAGDAQKKQQQQLQWNGCPHHTTQEGPAPHQCNCLLLTYGRAAIEARKPLKSLHVAQGALK